ncbi:MAG: TldD/PmbA family protein [Candidatus Odinarchaeota archaeon]
MDKDLIVDAGERLMKLAEQAAGESEAFITVKNTHKSTYENGNMKIASEIIDAGCGVRSIIDGKTGFAHVTTLEKEELKKTLEQAISNAKSACSDPGFKSLPGRNDLQNIRDIYDPAINSLQPEQIVQILMRTVNSSKEELVDYKTVYYAEISAITTWKSICNTSGMSVFSKETEMWLVADCTIKQSGKQANSTEFKGARKIDLLDPEQLGKKAAIKTRDLLGAKKTENGYMPVLFTPDSVETLFGRRGLARALKATEVQQKNSYLVDAMGEVLACEALEITDDALLPGGLNSRPFDDEGVASTKTEIISKGVLKSLLYDSYSACKDKTMNTANAKRKNYSDMPEIAPSNLIISPGQGSQQDLISEIKEGILCQATGDVPDLLTGNLSALVFEGFYIKQGEIKYPVKNTLIGTNILDLMNNVMIIGNDAREVFSVRSPSIIVDSCKITSG